MKARHAGYFVAHGMLIDMDKSSCIQSVQYVARLRKLFIRFRSNSDKVYAWKGVPQGTLTRMVKSPSPGRFYHRNINGRYQTTEFSPKGAR